MIPFRHRRLWIMAAVTAGWLVGASAVSQAAESTTLTWSSPGTGRQVPLRVLAPPDLAPRQTAPLVIYLLGLATPRIGTVADDTLLAEYLAAGCRVAVLDYAGAPEARWPQLNRDIQALREQLHRHTLLADRALDPAHIYIVPAGYRLRRDVEFYRDGARGLALDILYPAEPRQPVGALLEFSCDNQNRYGNYSLQVCSDTLLEAAATEGFAVALADHPVAAPYKGLDPMPDCAWKTKAAVRTLRALGATLGLNGRIVPVGFSRGSGMALLLVTTAGRSEFEGHGAHPATDSRVQGGVILSGRFTYLDLLPDDKMIPRYVAAWGPHDEQLAVWRAHGALDYFGQQALPPLFLSINATEAPEALHQMEVLRHRLQARGAAFVYHPETEPRGHKVPLAPAVLEPLLRYLRERLTGAPE